MECFRDASVWGVGSCLRSLFVSALVFGDLTEPLALWQRFGPDICDDLPHRIEREVTGVTIPPDFTDPHLDYGLFLIAADLQRYERSLAGFGLPEPQIPWQDHIRKRLVAAERNYDGAGMQAQLDRHYQQVSIHCKYLPWAASRD